MGAQKLTDNYEQSQARAQLEPEDYIKLCKEKGWKADERLGEIPVVSQERIERAGKVAEIELVSQGIYTPSLARIIAEKVLTADAVSPPAIDSAREEIIDRMEDALLKVLGNKDGYSITTLAEAAFDAIRARGNTARAETDKKLQHDERVEFLSGIVGVVEATSYEENRLWNHYHAGFGWPWKENAAGYLEGIGSFGGMPVCISLRTAVVNGQKLLFVEPCSQVVDHRMVESWLKDNLPSSALRENGYLNKVDAQNFPNVFRAASPTTDQQGGA